MDEPLQNRSRQREAEDAGRPAPPSENEGDPQGSREVAAGSEEARQEAKHFGEVCATFRNYAHDTLLEVARMEADFYSLSPEDIALLIEAPATRIADIKKAVRENQLFLTAIIEASQGDFRAVDGRQRAGSENDDCRQADRFFQPSLPRNISKIRSTLRQFVRDWSATGKWERDQAYDPLLTSLDAYLPVEDFRKAHNRVPKILCPGSGLGRLPFEIAKRGYACQGNEFCFFMLLASNFILNTSIPPETYAIYPYCLNTSNRLGHRDHLRHILIPDVNPSEALGDGAEFSMCGGEFVQVYWEQPRAWDGVMSCFFIDTAKNVLQYVRTIARALAPGGFWFNFGPLLYHFSGAEKDITIELSWEEIRAVAGQWFDFREQRLSDAYYTTDPLSLMQVVYHCIFFVARRNEAPVVGESHCVYT